MVRKSSLVRRTTGTNLYSANVGGAWQHIIDGDGGYTAIDPNNPDTVYGEFEQGDIYKADPADISLSSDISPNYVDPSNVPFIVPFQVSKVNTNDILVGADRLYESLDGGVSYNALSPEFDYSDYPDPITAFARSTVNPNVIYVGTEYGSVYMTSDGGSN